MNNENLKIHIFAFATFGDGLSGGDYIFMQFAKYWSRQTNPVVIHVFKDGYEMCKKIGIPGAEYRVYSQGSNIRFLPLFFLFRTIYAIGAAFKEKLKMKGDIIIYSASDFWPDAIPALILKFFFRRTKFIAGFYMFAPSPFRRNFPYRGINIIRGLSYYITQIPIYFLVKQSADFVLVTSQMDAKYFFTKRRVPEKVIVVQGGIDVELIDSVPEKTIKTFDAVFMGRLHPQKGVLELIDIWNLVIKMFPLAKLAIIGDGYLKDKILDKIKGCRLEDNIVFFGYKFGREKVEIFKSSKIILHPAIYDSGGMSACEAMACGLPGISFDLPALKSYYPKGMLKVSCFNLKEFSDTIIRLLSDEALYNNLSAQALALARGEWGWNVRAERIYNRIIK